MPCEFFDGEGRLPFDREQARRFADFAGILVVVLDLQGHISLINRTACDVLEAGSPQEVIGTDWFERFLPESSRTDVRAVFQRVISGSLETVEFYENAVQTATGAERVVQWHNAVLYDAAGAIAGTLSTGMDVTDRRQSQVKAEARAAQLGAFFRTAADGLLTIDEHGIIETANPACERMFEYPATELIGSNVSMLMSSSDAESHDNYLEQYLRTGERKVIGIGREVVARKKSGVEFPVFIAVSEMELGGERKFAGIIRDMTDLKDAQAALLKQESLARVGELASVVAHEVRNPLAGIGGALRILQGRLALREDEREVIHEILSRLDQLARTVDDLLVFARPRMPHVKPVPLCVLLEETLSILGEAPEFRALKIDVVCPEQLFVAGDAEMLKPVFHNIFLNAAQAMGGEGRLHIATESKPGSSIATVTITDTGPGIPEEHRAKVFQPFFSTKGTGTGLGLSIASRTLELHEGDIEISSAPGGGAAVTIRLPLAESPPKTT